MRGKSLLATGAWVATLAALPLSRSMADAGTDRVARVLTRVEAARRSAQTPELKAELQTITASLRKARESLKPAAKSELASKLDETRLQLEVVLRRVDASRHALRASLLTAIQETRSASYYLQPFTFTARVMGGRPVGDLVLGETGMGAAVRLFDPDDDSLARPQESKLTLHTPRGTVRTAYLYRPENCRYELYFDRARKLVMIVDGSAYGSAAHHELLRRYPDLLETDRSAAHYTLQAEPRPCVTLVMIMRSGEGVLDSMAYALTSETAR